MVDLFNPRFLLSGLLFKTSGTVVRFCQLCFSAGNILLIMDNGALQHGDGRFLFLGLSIQFRGIKPDALRLHVLLPHPLAILLTLGIEGVQCGTGFVTLSFRIVEVHLQLPGVHLQRVQIFQPHGDFQQTQLITKHQITLGLFGLFPQRLHLHLQLGNFIVDADQIVLGALQLALRLLLTVAELGDTGGFFKDLTALAALGRKDLVDLALTDDGITLPAQAGVHKQLRDIL